MNSLLDLALILGLLAVVPTLLKARELSMKGLAKRLELSFHSEPPRLLDFYLKFNLGTRDLNHIQGNLDSHSVHVYDKFKFFMLGTALPSRTVIEIDGVPLGEKNFTLGEVLFGGISNLMPAGKIRKIMQNLSKAGGRS